MLTQIGANKWMTRKSRWKEECWRKQKTVNLRENDRRIVLVPTLPYVRTIWDWFAGRRRVPVPVAEALLKEGIIEQYIPVTILIDNRSDETIALVKIPKHVYAVYMDYHA